MPSSKKSTDIEISGINVSFPHTPYPCQIEFMEKTIKALLNSTNALLESPTGTGKTLCLLCSTLAWQIKYDNQASKTNIPVAPPSIFDIPINNIPKNSKPGLIIYASRTHTQLKQVVKELNSTSYKPKSITLGSREQLCINEKISRMKGNSLNHACNSANAKHSCIYKNNLEGYNGAIEGVGTANPLTLDIEDIVKMGKKDKICPYFFSRDSSSNADIVLLPYNYLLDSSIRQTLKIEWRDSVVIFDEAHNLERVASDASSFSFSATEITSCISELKHVLRKLQSEDESQPGGTTLSETTDSEKKSFRLGGSHSLRPNIKAVMRLLKALFDIESRLDSVALSRSGGMKTNCSIHQGSWLVDLLEACGLSANMNFTNIDELKKCVDMLLEDANAGSLNSSSLIIPDPKLLLFSKVLSKVFRSANRQECVRLASDYRVYISEEELGKSQGNLMKKRVINYWCFSPGLAMLDLKNLGVRSIIMTSGTLSPMDAFKEDMKIPFPIELENPHVIQKNQIFVGALSHGPTGKQLNSSYGNRDTSDYKDELGKSILMICQTMASERNNNCNVPKGLDLKGGILIFFPSYNLMETAVERWKQTGLYERIEKSGGGIVIESRMGEVNKSSYKANSNDLYNPVKKSTAGCFVINGGGQSVNDVNDEAKMLGGLVKEFESNLSSNRRCIMLAVCRGKVSEGIDFRDSKARVVIITGIPFAPHMEPWVILKKQYLDEKRMTNSRIENNENATSLNNNKLKALLTGQSWYFQSASRAINQAIGRVIRHKNDWGAIFLLDDRFLSDNQISQLSGWVRPNVVKFKKSSGEYNDTTSDNFFSKALEGFHRFAFSAMNNPSLNRPETNDEDEEPSQTSSQKFHNNFKFIRKDKEEEEDEEPRASNREVIISATQIKETDSSTFVDPNLLKTQEKPKKNISIFHLKDTSNDTHRSESYVAPFTNLVKGIQSSNGSAKVSVDYAPFGLITNNNNTNKPNHSSTAVEKTDKNYFTSENNRNKNQHLQNNVNNSSVLDSYFNLNTKRGLDSKNFQNAFNLPTSKIDQTISNLSTENTFKSILNKSQQNTNEKMKIDSKDSSTLSQNDKFTAMKDYIAKLNVDMDKAAFKNFKAIILSAKSSGLSKISEINKFVAELNQSLKFLGETKLSETLKILTPLIPGKFLDLYGSTCRKYISSNSNRNSLDLNTNIGSSINPFKKSKESPSNNKFSLDRPKENDGGSSLNLSSKNNLIDEIQDKNINETIESFSQHIEKQASTYGKRTLQLFNSFQSSQSKSTPPMKKDRPNSILSQENFQKVNFSKKLNDIGKFAISSSTNAQSGKLLKSCIVCLEVSKDPYAAKCGHICCHDCWKHLFKIKKTCPMCRIDVSLENLVKIVIK